VTCASPALNASRIFAPRSNPHGPDRRRAASRGVRAPHALRRRGVRRARRLRDLFRARRPAGAAAPQVRDRRCHRTTVRSTSSKSTAGVPRTAAARSACSNRVNGAEVYAASAGPVSGRGGCGGAASAPGSKRAELGSEHPGSAAGSGRTLGAERVGEKLASTSENSCAWLSIISRWLRRQPANPSQIRVLQSSQLGDVALDLHRSCCRRPLARSADISPRAR
jgi:hypothetical protein